MSEAPIEIKAIPPDMTPDEFRTFAVGLLDDALGHSWFVRGDNRKFIEAVRTYLPQMPDDEIKKLIACVPR